MQTKIFSIIESITNTITGFFVSLIIQIIIYPMFNIPVTLNQNIIITSVFTGASILRGYIVRRIFTKLNKL